MNLRLRLVAALVLLSTLGLVVFGVVTYELYQRSLQDRLDEQLFRAIDPLSGRLLFEVYGEEGLLLPGTSNPTSGANDSSSGPLSTPTRSSRGLGAGPGFDAYGLLVGADGTVLASSSPLVTVDRPKISASLLASTAPALATVGSVEGERRWRVLVTPLDQVRGPEGRTAVPASLDGATVAVAVPASEVDDQMRRLLQIEVAAALALLTALAGGAWLVLRHGLRPLEQMASSAASITAGDLTQRVTPADDRTEVGQLGLALNTMLDGIEVSFHERAVVEERLRRFLADASHELRTPLTSIRGFAELFRLGPDDSMVDLPVIMRRIEEESARMGVLVDDLVTLARLDETRPFTAEPVDLAALAADACADVIAHDPSRPVVLDVAHPVVLDGDPRHLRQALANLVANAVRHTPAGTPVEVTVRRVEGPFVRLEVRDHGPGLDVDGLTHAFDRFWQADQARTGHGSGLGLAIVAAVAAEHGGRAWVEDAQPGARFVLDLPVSRPAKDDASGA